MDRSVRYSSIYPSRGPEFRCPTCINVFASWTQLTRHLKSSLHFPTECARCDQRLRCFGPLQPLQHEIATGHWGYKGVFFVRDDYKLNHGPFLTLPQYRCECGMVFECVLYIAVHLREEHGVDSIPNSAKCLTCLVGGTLGDMHSHRLERAKMRAGRRNVQASDGTQVETQTGGGTGECVFEVPGFSGAPYLLPRPFFPPWPPKKSTYTIKYQCTVCLSLFSSWATTKRHLRVTGHLRFFPPKDVERWRNGDKTALSEVKLKQELERLVDYDDEDMLTLLVDGSTGSEGHANSVNVLCGYQCPGENCGLPFLTHGELLQHMKKERHYPRTWGSMASAAGRSPYPPQMDVSQFEVTFTQQQLVEELGFPLCKICNRVLTVGSEQVHQQIYHTTHKAQGDLI